MTQYRQFTKNAPEEFNAWVVMRHAPPLPFLPEEVHGAEVIVLAVFHSGPIQEGEKIAETLSGFGDPHGVHVGSMPYVDWQKAFDPLLTPGARNYWKTHNFTDLSDEAMDKMIEFAGNMPSQQCEIFIALINGAAKRVAPDAMAYGHRDVNFVLNVHGRWDESSDDQKCVSWARDFYKASAPYASSGAYINFMTEEESDRVAAAYGANYERLAEIKRKYDPENIFHINQNIKS
jgi:FAD/FMN-containing dehydrogenase